MIQVVEVVRKIVAEASAMYALLHEEAQPVHFYADNFVTINNELSIRGKTSEGAKNKYPAVLLFCDHLPVRREKMKYWDVEATLHVLIVNHAVPDGDGNRQRVESFYPILYPVYECFIEAIRNSPRMFTKENALET